MVNDQVMLMLHDSIRVLVCLFSQMGQTRKTSLSYLEFACARVSMCERVHAHPRARTHLHWPVDLVLWV